MLRACDMHILRVYVHAYNVCTYCVYMWHAHNVCIYCVYIWHMCLYCVYACTHAYNVCVYCVYIGYAYNVCVYCVYMSHAYYNKKEYNKLRVYVACIYYACLVCIYILHEVFHVHNYSFHVTELDWWRFRFVCIKSFELSVNICKDCSFSETMVTFIRKHWIELKKGIENKNLRPEIQ